MIRIGLVRGQYGVGTVSVQGQYGGSTRSVWGQYKVGPGVSTVSVRGQYIPVLSESAAMDLI